MTDEKHTATLTANSIIDYYTQDKSSWGDGPWNSEPDKRQWKDETTGFPCLAVRTSLGHWCGYVGVNSSHPWHGKNYSDKALYTISVHGGLTFSDECVDLSVEHWQKMRKTLQRAQKESAQYPASDAVRWTTTWGSVLDSFPAWREKMQSTAICHIPAPGEPDDIWWFGFDCAHGGDHSPGMKPPLIYRGEYRTLEYVMEECAKLAQQLETCAEPIP